MKSGAILSGKGFIIDHHTVRKMAVAQGQNPTRSILQSKEALLDDLLQRICVKLQITRTQYELAESRYKAVGKWLARDEGFLGRLNLDIYSQGSLRIGTTTKPWAKHQEFDLDLVLQSPVDWWRIGNPIALLDAVEERLRKNGTYAPMLERKNRCIRLNYEGDFHMDILPACGNPSGGHNCVKVPDRQALSWKDSNPIGFANWFLSKAQRGRFVKFSEYVEPLPAAETVEQKAPLKRVVQLIKRARDVAFEIERAFDSDRAPASIVLTTLAAQIYTGSESTSISLLQILDGLQNAINRAHPRLTVLNPTNKDEVFSERWDADSESYRQFTAWIASFRASWEEVTDGMGIHRVAAKLEALFGEKVTREALKDQTEFIEHLRANKRLGVNTRTGLSSAIGSSSVVSVKPNTFYGE